MGIDPAYCDVAVQRLRSSYREDGSSGTEAMKGWLTPHDLLTSLASRANGLSQPRFPLGRRRRSPWQRDPRRTFGLANSPGPLFLSLRSAADDVAVCG